MSKNKSMEDYFNSMIEKINKDETPPDVVFVSKETALIMATEAKDDLLVKAITALPSFAIIDLVQICAQLKRDDKERVSLLATREGA
jgi:hypothetical protein